MWHRWTSSEGQTAARAMFQTMKTQIVISDEKVITDSMRSFADRTEVGGADKKCTCRYLWKNDMHGLSELLKRRPLIVRIGWATIIAVCFWLSLAITIHMFGQYFERHTVTYDSLKQPHKGLKLPVIVLCPKNPDTMNFRLVKRDIAKRFPSSALSHSSLEQMVRFAVAGAGFSNVQRFMPNRRKKQHGELEVVAPFVTQKRRKRKGEEGNGKAGAVGVGGLWVGYHILGQIDELDALFRRWRGNRSLSEFYKNFFDDWGYKCNQFILKCYFGYKLVHNCCSYFEPYFVRLRGRCLRMNVTLHQRDPSDIGRFDVYMNQMPSRMSIGTSQKQPQVVVYLTDNDRNVGLFTRYYINFRTALILRARARKISMLPNGDSKCRTYNSDEVNRNTCQLKQWLREKVIKPHNCTLFYLNFDNGTVCDPKLIVENYAQIIDLRLMKKSDGEKCHPACERFEHFFREFHIKSSILNDQNYAPPFRIQVAFTSMQLEVYKEARTLSIPRFISQLGGQFSLYLGLSVGSLIQLIISVVRKCHRWMAFRLEERQRIANWRQRPPPCSA